MQTIKKLLFSFLFIGVIASLSAQEDSLSVAKIMQNPATWVGTSPNRVSWSWDSKAIYFQWNPEQKKSDSLYRYDVDRKKIEKVGKQERLSRVRNLRYSSDRRIAAFEQAGDIYVFNTETGESRAISLTKSRERFLAFDDSGEKLFFQQSNNVFSWQAADGLIEQLTDFRKGSASTSKKTATENEAWVKQEEEKLIQILAEREDLRQARQEASKADRASELQAIFTGAARLENIKISPNGRYISYRLTKQAKSKRTEVPAYVDASGFTKNLPARPKVGSPQTRYASFLYDTQKDTVLELSLIHISEPTRPY